MQATPVTTIDNWCMCSRSKMPKVIILPNMMRPVAVLAPRVIIRIDPLDVGIPRVKAWDTYRQRIELKGINITHIKTVKSHVTHEDCHYLIFHD